MPAIFQPHPLLGPQNSPHSASGWGEKGKNQKWEDFVVFKESGDVHIPGQDCVSMPGGWEMSPPCGPGRRGNEFCERLVSFCDSQLLQSFFFPRPGKYPNLLTTVKPEKRAYDKTRL